MESSNPKIIHVERIDVVVDFDGGQTGLYSAALLYEMRIRARDLTDLACDDE